MSSGHGGSPPAQQTRLTAANSRAVRRHEVVLLLLLAISGAYFHGGGASNQNVRFDAMVAAVEGEGFRIDRFMRGPGGVLTEPPPTGGNTVDWSFSPPDGVIQPEPGSDLVAGHYYANKAPGTILIGSAVYAVVRGTWGAFGAVVPSPAATEVQLYLVNLLLSQVENDQHRLGAEELVAGNVPGFIGGEALLPYGDFPLQVGLYPG